MRLRGWLGYAWVNLADDPRSFEADVLSAITERLGTLEGIDGCAAQYYAGHGAEFGDEIKGFTVDGGEGFEELLTLEEDRDRKYCAITIKPQVFSNLVPDHVIVHRMYSPAADRTVVECDWLYAKEVADTGRDVSRSVELFHRVNEQDFETCERCQPAMASRAHAHDGVRVPSEHHIGGFHDWLVRKLESAD